jgi:hypothetical protein
VVAVDFPDAAYTPETPPTDDPNADNNEDANNTAEAPYPPFGEPGSYADELRYFIDNNGDEITYIWRFDGIRSWSIYENPYFY